MASLFYIINCFNKKQYQYQLIEKHESFDSVLMSIRRAYPVLIAKSIIGIKDGNS